MPIKTQGSQLWGLIPNKTTGVLEVIEIIGALDLNPGSNPSDQIETTALSERDSKTYMRGLRTPGQFTFNVNATPGNASHVRLSELAESDADDAIKWVIGWSDGTSVPTLNVAVDDFQLPTDRTWFKLSGYVADFPFDFQANTVVKTAASIQRSGPGQWIVKGAAV